MMNAAKQPGGQGRAVVCYVKGWNRILKKISDELKTKISEVPEVRGQKKGSLTFVKEDTWHNTIMPLGKWKGGKSCNPEKFCCWRNADVKAASIFKTVGTETFAMHIGPESLTAKQQDKNKIIKIYPTYQTPDEMDVDIENKNKLNEKFRIEPDIADIGNWRNARKWVKRVGNPHITIAYITKNLAQDELKALERWRISALAQLKGKEFTCVPEIAFFDAVVGNWGGITKNIRKTSKIC